MIDTFSFANGIVGVKSDAIVAAFLVSPQNRETGEVGKKRPVVFVDMGPMGLQVLPVDDLPSAWTDYDRMSGMVEFTDEEGDPVRVRPTAIVGIGVGMSGRGPCTKVHLRGAPAAIDIRDSVASAIQVWAKALNQPIRGPEYGNIVMPPSSLVIPGMRT